jgi:Uma2 family endonuclease
MGLAAKQHRHSILEYYRIENDSTERHEFRDGEILAMSGGSPQHSLIAVNIAAELRNRVKGKPCLPYGSDLRVRIAGRNQSVYPDVSVICGQIDYDPDDKAGHTVHNPRVIVEVLSASTEAYDRGDKFAAYRQIPSFFEYVIVSQSEPRVETFRRQEDGSWLISFFVGLDAVARLASIGVDLPLAEIYARVEFPPAEARSPLSG